MEWFAKKGGGRGISCCLVVKQGVSKVDSAGAREWHPEAGRQKVLSIMSSMWSEGRARGCREGLGQSGLMEEVEQSAGEVEEAEDRAEESVVEGNGVEGEEEKEDEEESGGGMEKAVWASHTNWEVAWSEPTQDWENGKCEVQNAKCKLAWAWWYDGWSPTSLGRPAWGIVTGLRIYG